MIREWNAIEQQVVELEGEQAMIVLEKIAKKAAMFSHNEYHGTKFVSGCYYCNLLSGVATKDELMIQQVLTESSN